MDVIFMGTPEYAKVILERLLQRDGINVVAVYTQPDKPVGRKKIMTAPEVKVVAQQNAIKVYQPVRLRDEATVEELLQIKCDFIVVAAYGQILPKAILEHAPCINLHASILPQYRGASPIQQTLLHGDTKTGVTAMLMDEGLDTGAILKISSVDVPADMMAETLFESLTQCAADLTLDVLENFSKYPPQKQDTTKATHCTKITKQDGAVAFLDAQTLYNKYRAYTPWPGIYLSSGLKLKRISLMENISENAMGKIVKIESDGVIVGCKQGSIKIFSVQPESKNEMDILSYINGKRLQNEDILS